MRRYTVKAFFKQFPDDEACLEAIRAKRMGGDRMVCKKCGKDARFYRVGKRGEEKRRAYACQFCGDHFYPCVGTPFEDSRTSLQSWFYAAFLFTTTRHGVPAKELERQLGVTYKTAWRIAKKLRELMNAQDTDDDLGGIVEIDEAYFGGDKRDGKTGRGATGKTLLVGLTERGGRTRAIKVPNARTVTLRPIIEDNVDRNALIMTDELKSYALLKREGWDHQSVNHARGEYARGIVHTNTIEWFWGRLKASINGTHVHVSSKYLPLYAAEFSYRANHRHEPAGMFARLIGAACRA